MATTVPGQERKRLGVRILTPEGAVYDDQVAMLVAPSVLGEVGILPRHTPFIAFLRTGETKVKTLEDEEIAFATGEGYLSVEEDRVLVLVEQAERADQIDRDRAQRTKEDAERQVKEAGDDEERKAEQEKRLRRVEVRLELAGS